MIWSGQMVPPEELRAFQSRHRTGSSYLLYVGHRFAYKNFGTLLRGWERFRQNTGSSVRLVCVGPGNFLDGHHIDFLIARGLVEELVMLSDLNECELRCAYQGAQLFIFPSLWEGFGLPVLEAAAFGVPLLLSNIPVFYEVAGDAALYFDPYDEADLATQIALALTGPENSRLRELSRELPQKYSWDRAADIHADVYRRLSGAGRSAVLASRPEAVEQL